jgi:5-methyltetrahydropteroyltriglutamate--homocysteine methyltransferase
VIILCLIIFRQAIITPSALSMVYPKATIEGYSREQFLADLMNEAEKDIRKCFDSGAHSVQLDFTEARFSLKIDPTGSLLREFVRINNKVLDRFEPNIRDRLGVHVCPGLSFNSLLIVRERFLILGGDKDCYHSFEVDYLLVLPALFELHVGNFFLQLTSEHDRHRVLSRIRDLLQSWQRVFVGVIDPLNNNIETPEEVCERVLEAAEYIPVEQLGTTDDCGFSPFDDDQSTSRQIAFDKIRARIQGTELAEDKLNSVNKKTYD